MPTKTHAAIYVQALTDEDNVIVPQLWLGADIEHKGETCADYHTHMNLPTLSEIREVVPNRYVPITIINRPEVVFFDSKRNLWSAEFDSKNAFDVLEPPIIR